MHNLPITDVSIKQGLPKPIFRDEVPAANLKGRGVSITPPKTMPSKGLPKPNFEAMIPEEPTQKQAPSSPTKPGQPQTLNTVIKKRQLFTEDENSIDDKINNLSSPIKRRIISSTAEIGNHSTVKVSSSQLKSLKKKLSKSDRPQKKPFLYTIGYQSEIIINGESHRLDPIGKGKFHSVYSLATNPKFLADKTQNNLILKIPSGNSSEILKSGLAKFHENDLKAYNYLLENSVPVPNVYVSPTTDLNDPYYFNDLLDETNGGFWIMERMKSNISCKGWETMDSSEKLDSLAPSDLKLLMFVKNFLTKSANEKKEIINDFYPRNMMEGNDGNFYVVDFSLPIDSNLKFNEDFEWQQHLYSYVKAWANGNSQVWTLLISDFEPGIKAWIENKMKIEIETNGGEFPLSKQTYA